MKTRVWRISAVIVSSNTEYTVKARKIRLESHKYGHLRAPKCVILDFYLKSNKYPKSLSKNMVIKHSLYRNKEKCSVVLEHKGTLGL